jgi:hypothetical protein
LRESLQFRSACRSPFDQCTRGKTRARLKGSPSPFRRGTTPASGHARNRLTEAPACSVARVVGDPARSAGGASPRCEGPPGHRSLRTWTSRQAPGARTPEGARRQGARRASSGHATAPTSGRPHLRARRRRAWRRRAWRRRAWRRTGGAGGHSHRKVQRMDVGSCAIRGGGPAGVRRRPGGARHAPMVRPVRACHPGCDVTHAAQGLGHTSRGVPREDVPPQGVPREGVPREGVPREDAPQGRTASRLVM